MKKQVHSNYTKVPEKLIKLKLSGSEFRVLIYLMSWQRREKCFVKQFTIATACAISLSATKKALKYLAEQKFISISSGKGDHTSNIYEVNFDVIDGDCVFTSEENELRSIEFNRKQAMKITPHEMELRETLTKAGNS